MAFKKSNSVFGSRQFRADRGDRGRGGGDKSEGEEVRARERRREALCPAAERRREPQRGKRRLRHPLWDLQGREEGQRQLQVSFRFFFHNVR